MDFSARKVGTEGVDLSERRGRRFAVELPRLGEVGVPLLEVLRGEEPGPLADRRREDRRIDAQEAALVEEVVDRLLDFVPDHHDRTLPRRPEPEVPVVEQEVDAVLLRLDRVVARTRPDDGEPGHTDVQHARRARILARFAGDGDGRLRRQLGEARPELLADLALHEHGLRGAGAVTQRGESDLA